MEVIEIYFWDFIWVVGFFGVILIVAHIGGYFEDKHRNDPEKIMERMRSGCATKEEEDLFHGTNLKKEQQK